jgi:hypothetical protein
MVCPLFSPYIEKKAIMTLHLPDHLLQQYSEAESRLEIALALFQREMMTLGRAFPSGRCKASSSSGGFRCTMM